MSTIIIEKNIKIKEVKLKGTDKAEITFHEGTFDNPKIDMPVDAKKNEGISLLNQKKVKLSISWER